MEKCGKTLEKKNSMVNMAIDSKYGNQTIKIATPALYIYIYIYIVSKCMRTASLIIMIKSNEVSLQVLKITF